MRHRDRSTVCVSSQSGCPLKCTFCATGSMGLGRNLTRARSSSRCWCWPRCCASRRRRVTNVVMMGMGEPFLNYDEVLPPAARSTTPRASDWAPVRSRSRRPAGSRGSSGWRPSRCRSLALSLHAPNDELRATADAGQPPLPAAQADGRLPGLPRGHRPPDLHRVPAARRGQRHATPHADRAGGPARPGGGFHVNLISYNPTQAGYTGSGQRGWRLSPAVLASWACRPPTAAPTAATSTPPAASSPSGTCGGCAAATAARRGRISGIIRRMAGGETPWARG